jgi:hypothetical protein
MTSKLSWLHMTQAEDDSHSTVQQNSRSMYSLPYHVSNTVVIDEEDEGKDTINNILTLSREKRRLKRIILLYPLNDFHVKKLKRVSVIFERGIEFYCQATSTYNILDAKIKAPGNRLKYKLVLIGSAKDKYWNKVVFFLDYLQLINIQNFELARTRELWKQKITATQTWKQKWNLDSRKA